MRYTFAVQMTWSEPECQETSGPEAEWTLSDRRQGRRTRAGDRVESGTRFSALAGVGLDGRDGGAALANGTRVQSIGRPFVCFATVSCGRENSFVLVLPSCPFIYFGV